MRRLVTAGAIAMLLFGGASAQQSPPVTRSAEASIHSFGDADKTCAEWTDGCRTCTRRTDSAPACSNIGPACQPTVITCSRRSEPAK